MPDGYYRDEGWQFVIVGPEEQQRLDDALPDDARTVHHWRTKAEWLALGAEITAHNPDGSPVGVSTAPLHEFPDDAHIVLQRRIFHHPNADPLASNVDEICAPEGE